MKISVHNSCEDHNSYRAARVKSLFNPERGNVFTLEDELDLPDDWQIGLVVGSSGTGKTSIGRSFFGPETGIYDLYEGWDNSKPIIDCIAPDGNFDVVTAALSNVGLGDVPAWLRPFSALSNGQKFRAGLARIMADPPETAIVDEFTSVVDRQIAKIGAMAFGKGWRRNKGKKIVLLSCHYDIIEWLQPDWVYHTDTRSLKKKTKSDSVRSSNFAFSRQIPVTGEFLKSITI